MARKSRERLKADAASALARYFEEGRHNTDHLRTAAGDIVELRSRFSQKDGSTDWAGRSTDYREAIRDVYTRAHLSPEQIRKLPTTLNYHVRQALEARLTPDELAEAGFKAANPKDAQQARRKASFAVAQAVSFRPTGDPESFLQAVARAAALAEVAVDHSSYAEDLTRGQAELVLSDLEGLSRHADELRRVVTAVLTRG